VCGIKEIKVGNINAPVTHTGYIVGWYTQWRTEKFCSCWGGGSKNSVEDRENGDLEAVAP